MKVLIAAVITATGTIGLGKYQASQHHSVIHGGPIETPYESIDVTRAVPCKEVKVDSNYRITNHSVITSHVIDRHLKGVLKGKIKDLTYWSL